MPTRPESRALASPQPPHTRWPVAAAAGVLGALVVAVVVLAFLWPTKTSEPSDLPISLAGPAPAVAALQTALGSASPDTFDFTPAASRDEAVAQIKSRETYGAIVLAGQGQAPEVLTAPAGSAVAAQMLTAVATQLQAQLVQQTTAAGGDASTAKVTVTPVVPLAGSDPTGTGLAAASFPLMLGGMIGGVLASLAVVGVARRLLTVTAFAIATGLVLTLVLQTWFDYLQGSFWLNVVGIGLSVLATSSFIVGCAALLGRAGIPVGAAFTMLIGNPISAAATPWQFLPEPFGAIGQYLVPGAANSLVRSLSYFPDAANTQQWWVLIGWTTLGVVLATAGHYRSRPAITSPDATLEHANRQPATA